MDMSSGLIVLLISDMCCYIIARVGGKKGKEKGPLKSILKRERMCRSCDAPASGAASNDYILFLEAFSRANLLFFYPITGPSGEPCGSQKNNITRNLLLTDFWLI